MSHHKKCGFLVMDSDARIQYTQFSQCYMPDSNSKELMRGGNTLREVRAIKRLVPHQKVGRRIPIHRNGHCNEWTISDNGRTIPRLRATPSIPGANQCHLTTMLPCVTGKRTLTYFEKFSDCTQMRIL